MGHAARGGCVVALSAACLLLMLACGGGSSAPTVAPPPTEALLEGHAFRISVQACGSGFCVSELGSSWGLLSFDGAGTVVSQGTSNSAGVVVRSPGVPLGYEVDADRQVRVLQAGTVFWEGSCSADGDLLGGGSPDGDPELTLAGRREGFYEGVVGLTGAWHVCALSWSEGLDALGALYGEALFDDVGVGNVILATNLDGDVYGTSAALGQGIVRGDGALVLAVGGSLALEGGLVREGRLALLGGGTRAGESPAVFVLVRQGATLTTPDLQGTWRVVAFERDVATGAFASGTGRGVADAAGNLQLSLTWNVDGTPLTPPPSAAGWAAALDGGLLLTREGGATLVGGVTSDGRFAVVAGGTADGDDPALFVMYR